MLTYQNGARSRKGITLGALDLEYELATQLDREVKTEMVRAEQTVQRRPPRITCLLALALRFEELVRSGEVNDYADLAQLGGVSRARVSQILKLLTRKRN